MTVSCPKCQSLRIDAHHYGRRTGALIGTVAGAVSVAAGILRSSEFGLSPEESCSDQLAFPIGTLAGAILGGLLGGTAGGATGAKLGEFLDSNLFKNYQCIECGYKFDTAPNAEEGHVDVKRDTYSHDPTYPSHFGPISHNSHNCPEQEEDFS